MVRMSILRNIPVICENKQLGLLQSISLDSAQKRVLALIVSCGMRGKRVVLPEHVLSIADGFILADEVQKYKRAYETQLCSFVRDTTGLLCGRVGDYALCEETLCVAAIELIPGYLPGESRNRIWLFVYERPNEEAGELLVPISLGSELILSKEEVKSCVYPP